MDDQLAVVKSGLQEILKKRYEERDAQMAMDLISEYENTLSRLNRMRPVIERLENGEDIHTVVSDYYNTKEDCINSKNSLAGMPMRNNY